MEFAKIWPLACHNWVKFWPRTKNNTTNREYSARAICWSFPRSSTTLRLETPRGGRTNPPPPTPAKVAKHRLRARVKRRAEGETLNPRPAGGGAKGPPCGFSQVAPEVLGVSLWNLPYLSGQQFHTLCQKIRTQVIIGQPWVTSEWRHVSPILTSKMGLRESPPLVQF